MQATLVARSGGRCVGSGCSASQRQYLILGTCSVSPLLRTLVPIPLRRLRTSQTMNTGYRGHLKDIDTSQGRALRRWRCVCHAQPMFELGNSRARLSRLWASGESGFCRERSPARARCATCSRNVFKRHAAIAGVEYVEIRIRGQYTFATLISTG